MTTLVDALEELCTATTTKITDSHTLYTQTIVALKAGYTFPYTARTATIPTHRQFIAAMLTANFDFVCKGSRMYWRAKINEDICDQMPWM